MTLMGRYIILFMLMLTSCAEMLAGMESLRIMTYNVPRKNEYILPEGVNTLEMRYAALADMVNNVRPDVLGMQEPTNSDLWMFLKNLKGYTMIGIGRDGTLEGGQYTLILYRSDKFYIEKHGFYFLSKTPDVMGSSDWGSSCSRLATWGIFRDKKTQARFLYTNTHLDHISDSARTNQMRVIKEHMRDIIAENGNMPMMITGDFNVSQTTQGAYVNATTLHIPMNDAWVVAKRKEGLSYSFPAHGNGTQRKLDYIILSKDITVNTAYIGNSAQPNGTIISDHNPHWADITWTMSADEDTEKLLYDARSAYDSTLVFTSKPAGLITNATEGSAGCQLSYDTKEPGSGALANLIDGNTSTHFRSSWSQPNPYQPHYFQVDLRKAYQNVHFRYARLDGSESTATGNCWADVLVTASNDGVNWDYADEFCAVPTEEGLHTFPTITMSKPYRYMRFSALRTPDMKIRSSFVQYVLSEFQLYEDVIDTLRSQRFFNPEVKAACDGLRPLVEEAEQSYRNGTLTKGQTKALTDALQALRAVKIDKTALRDLLASSADVLATYGYGTKFGQVTVEAYNELQTLTKEYNDLIEGMDTKAKVDEAYARLTVAREAFLASRTTFETNKWYYVQNRHLLKNTKQKEYGQALYADGNGSGAELRNGFYILKRNKLECLQNPYAMWRIVSLDNGTYALQNRATGFYLGGLNKEGTNYRMSATPTPYLIDMPGVEDFHFSVAGKSGEYLTAVTDGSVVASDEGYHSAAAWILTPVDDESVSQVQIPVKNHHVDIMTLPFAFENTDDGINTYCLNGMPSTGVLCLKKKTSFAAGEPFFILTGEIEALDASCEETVYMNVSPPDLLVTTPVTANGLYGLLDEAKMPKVGYVVQDNKLKMTRVTLPANSGYVIQKEIVTVDDDYDMTLTTSGVSSVALPVVGNGNKVSVYSADGRCVARDLQPADILKKLPKGLYIVGNKKVIIP